MSAFQDMTAIQAAALWSGALILLITVLAFRVIANRRRHSVLFGDGGVMPMTIAARAFGNAAEYIPVSVGALILLALTGELAWPVHLAGATLLVGRVIHGFGLSAGPGPGLPRMVGMTLTLLALIGAAIKLIAAALIG